MPQPSPEIEQVVRLTIAAMAQADLDTIERYTSNDPCLVGIGTDPDEWVDSHDALMALYRESIQEGEVGVTVTVETVEAFAEGDVGWAAARGHLEADGERIGIRMTLVLHREDGGWKAVQSHASIGVSNDSLLEPVYTAS